MGIAFDHATAALAVGAGEEVKRETVAHFILDYVRTHQSADAAEIRDAAVRSLVWLAIRNGSAAR
jgi:hypothetical protein